MFRPESEKNGGTLAGKMGSTLPWGDVLSIIIFHKFLAVVVHFYFRYLLYKNISCSITIFLQHFHLLSIFISYLVTSERYRSNLHRWFTL